MADSGNTQPGRATPDSYQLGRMVSEEVAQHLNAGLPFTAYDITQVLRASHPDLEIDHNAVRGLVADIADQEDLEVTFQTFATGTARTFARAPALPSLPSADGNGGDGPSGGDLLPGIPPVG